ncbi:MAG: MFS transporter [Alphaproteobacteria bacterium]|nr:MFS transporter [Alphaproteobacteria bacterium]
MSLRHTLSRRLALFRQPEFRRLWLVGTLAEGMRWVEMLTMSVYIYEVTRSALAVAFFNFLRLIPLLLMGAFTGSLAERLDRKRLYVGGLAITTMATGFVGVLALFDRIELWHIALATLIGGIAFTTEFPVRRNLLADVAGEQNVGAAIGIDSITRQCMRMAGPAAGGILLQETGLAGTYLTETVVYALCLVLVIRMRERRSPATAVPPTTRPSLIADTIAGIRTVRAHRALAGILLVSLVAQILLFPYGRLIPVIGKDVLELTPALVGVLASAEGMGALVGASLCTAFIEPRHYRQAYFIGSAGFGIGIIAFSLAPTFGLAIAALFVAGLGIGFFSNMQVTLPQFRSPPGMRGRMMGLLSVVIGIGPFGVLYAGGLAEWLGTQNAITLIGVQALIALGALALYWNGRSDRAVP